MRNTILLVAVLTLAGPCLADSEGPPNPVVYASQWGRHYVKSVPTPDSWEDQTAGTTTVYRTKAQEDELLCKYDWYAGRLWLYFQGGDLTLIRQGPWHRIGNAPEEEIELGFYRDGEVLKKYTVMDIAGDKDNLVHSISHYRVTSRVKGIVKGEKGIYFEIRTLDGRDLRFDLANGQRLKEKPKSEGKSEGEGKKEESGS